MMDQVYVANLEKIQADIADQAYQLARIADWMAPLVEEMRYANAMTRLTLEGGSVAKLRGQGY